MRSIINIIIYINSYRRPGNKYEAFIEVILDKQFSAHSKDKRTVEKLFESSPIRDPDSPEREIKAGHLMRVPHSKKDSKNNTFSSDHNGIHSRNFNQGKSHTSTNPLDQKEAMDRSCWSKREEDWYDVEEKLLFKNNKQNVDGDK